MLGDNDNVNIQFVERLQRSIDYLTEGHETLIISSTDHKARLKSIEALLKTSRSDIELVSDRIVQFRREVLEEVKEMVVALKEDFRREREADKELADKERERLEDKEEWDKAEGKEKESQKQTLVPVWAFTSAIALVVIAFGVFAKWIVYVSSRIGL